MGRNGAATVVAALLLVAGATSETGGPPVHTPPPGASSLTVTASTSKAGARDVAIGLTARYEMQCGDPGPGPLIVTLPAAAGVPSSLPPGALLVAGKPVRATISGHRITTMIPVRKGAICDVIGPGRVAVTLTRQAAIRNPVRPGSYLFTFAHARRRLVAALRISAS